MSIHDDFILPEATVAIVGLGLMGGSLALALKDKCASLYGLDSDPAVIQLARSWNLADDVDTDPARLLAEAEVVILAAPVPAILQLLDRLPVWIPDGCIVMDLGSTKQAIVEAMSRLPTRFDPIGAHPICGREKLSLANADSALYRSAPFVLTPLDRTSPRAVAAAHQIVEAIGAQPVQLEAAEHDRILASTSHLPFLLSSALALATAAEAAPLVGPGFRSTSRLAGTPSSMMLGVLETNRENVLKALQDFTEYLAAIESALVAGDFSSLERILDGSRCKYQSIASHSNDVPRLTRHAENSC